MKVIRKIGFALFKDKKILMVKTTTNNFRFLGGKVEGEETDLECLEREVREEVSARVDRNTLKLLFIFKAPVERKENTFIEMPLYTGVLLDKPIPANEVVEVLFVDSSLEDVYKTPLTIQTFQWLKENEYIR